MSIGHCEESSEQALKRLLQTNNMTLLVYPEGKLSLLNVLAEAIHLESNQLHEQIVTKLKQDYADEKLPRKLRYIYTDYAAIEDYTKHPNLVNFNKITLEMFHALLGRKVQVYYVSSYDAEYSLNCLIVNEQGCSESISVAKIDNKYYNVREKGVTDISIGLSTQSVNEEGLSMPFRGNQIDSEDFIRIVETFKSEVFLHPIQKVLLDREERDGNQRNQRNPKERKSADKYEFNHVDKLIEDDGSSIILKRAKSVSPSKAPEDQSLQKDKSPAHEVQKEVLETELNRDDEDLIIKECNNSIEHRNAYQGRMLPPEMSMYYPAMMYYPGHPQAFPVYAGGGKSETFLPYSPAPSHSPGKNSSAYKNLNQFYPTPNYPAQNVYSPQQPYTQTNIFSARQEGSIPQQTEILENERFTGRLKFFDDGKNYGFIIMDADESDIFVHYDDLQKAGITKQTIKLFKQNEVYMRIRFSFKVMEYYGRYRKSRKAVELQIEEDSMVGIGRIEPFIAE